MPRPHRLRPRLVAVVTALLAAVAPLTSPAAVPAASAATTGTPGGYWLVASDGGIFNYGAAKFFGSTGAIKLNQPIVGMAPTATGNGYWLVASDGGIFSFGDAGFFGSTGGIHLNKPIVGMAPTATGNGYWLVASDGGIFAFGDAGFFGSTGNIKLNKPITGMTPSTTGGGYRMVATDGGIFSFGDATFFGSLGGTSLARPVSGMAPTPSGAGYWMTSTDGRVFPFGDAGSFGSADDKPATGPRTMVAMVPSPTGQGYWEASATGELLAFGDAPDLGGPANLTRPIVGMAAVPLSAAAPTTTDPTGLGGPDPTGPTTPTTSLTGPPVLNGGPRQFSSVPGSAWGTLDQTEKDPLHPGRSLMDNKTGTKPIYAQEVKAIAQDGNRIFVGGVFTNITTPPPHATPAAPAQPILTVFDKATGAPVPGSTFNATATAGYDPASWWRVNALVVDKARNRLYVGGDFARLGGQAVHNLAALNLDTGAIDPTFAPPAPDKSVEALALAGDRLYMGGAFTTVGADARAGVAALDVNSGAILPLFADLTNYGGAFVSHVGKATDNPTPPDPTVPPLTGGVDTLAVPADGKTVWVGGDFLHLGTPHASDPNHQHGGLIVLDTATGHLTPWQPIEKYPVNGLAVWPGDGATVFTATGGPGGSVQSFLMNSDPARSKPQWTGRLDGDATGVVATAERVYLVGHFDHEVPNPLDKCLTLVQQPNGQLGISCPGGTPNRHLAAFFTTGGADAKGNPNGIAQVDTSFTAQADTPEGPSTAFVGTDALYIGGNFSKVYESRADQGGIMHQAPGFAFFPATS